MAKVVKELLTKWTYKVDTVQLRKATRQIIALKKKLLEVRRSSVTFGKQEGNQLRNVGKSWQRATNQVNRYRKAKNKALTARGGFVASAAGAGASRRGGGAGRSIFGGAVGGRLATLASSMGAGAFGGLALAGGGLGVGGGLLGAGATIGLAAKKEQAREAISGLLGETGKEVRPETDKLLGDIVDFAKKTPFRIGQLRELSGTLIAGDIAAKDVISTLRMLGDVTRGNNDKLQRMLINFLQIKNVGKASAIDMRQFALAQIPIFQTLQKQLGKSGEEIRKMVRDGKITFEVVEKAFKEMTGSTGRFFNGMEIQSRTFIGILSNIADGFEAIGTAIGDIFLDDIKAIADSFRVWLNVIEGPLIGRITSLTNAMKDFFGLVKGGFDFIIEKSLDLTNTWTNIKRGIALALAVLFPWLAVLAAVGLAIEDISRGFRGLKSDSLKFIESFKQGGFLGVLQEIVATLKEFLGFGEKLGPKTKKEDEREREIKKQIDKETLKQFNLSVDKGERTLLPREIEEQVRKRFNANERLNRRMKQSTPREEEPGFFENIARGIISPFLDPPGSTRKKFRNITVEAGRRMKEGGNNPLPGVSPLGSGGLIPPSNANTVNKRGGDTFNSTFNQTNNVEGEAAGQDVIERSQEGLRQQGQEFRANRAN